MALMGDTEEGRVARIQFGNRSVWVDGKRVTIPTAAARRHGIEVGSRYSVYVYTEDGGEIHYPSKKIGTDYTITIDQTMAENHDVEPGDRVTVAVELFRGGPATLADALDGLIDAVNYCDREGLDDIGERIAALYQELGQAIDDGEEDEEEDADE